MIRPFFDAALDLLFPPKCPFCGKVTERAGVCPECEKTLPWTGEKEGLRTLSGGLRCAAPLWYEGPVREGIHRLKFGGASGGAEAMGELVARCAAENFSGEFDGVCWVPVSKKRLRKRGYDQSELLARAACRLWDTKPLALLEKIGDNPPQSGLKEAAERRANVLGMYRASPRTAGMRLLLIDDVCTTGSTMEACAAALEEAGAAGVVCAALALTRK